MKKKIRMGMVGGGKDAFIGAVHRMAANLDGEVELVCGSFSSSAEKSAATGESLGLDPDRVYPSFEAMMEKERALPEDKRMQFVSIVTPNHLHYGPARLALEKGFHVLCEKPLSFTIQEAQELEALVKRTGLLFGVTHNYTGYPMVKQAREMVRSGKLGRIRKVVAEYPQGWLSGRIEQSGQKQAAWRTDPAKAGISCCVGDIGTHAENLAEYITGLKITEVAADVTSFVEGRTLDDDANVLLRMENGVKGLLFASQIATGEENELKIRIYGDQGGLEWLQSDPNTLTLKPDGQPKQIYRTGNGYLSRPAQVHSRLPGGHPEGYIESLANLYRNFAFAVGAVAKKETPDAIYDFPTVSDGVRGMKFIEAVISSGNNNSQWTKIA